MAFGRRSPLEEFAKSAKKARERRESTVALKNRVRSKAERGLSNVSSRADKTASTFARRLGGSAKDRTRVRTDKERFDFDGGFL